jgi:hypothetical protein
LNGRPQDAKIILVPQFDLRKNDRIDQQSILLQEPEEIVDQLWRFAELGFQHSVKLAQHLPGYEEFLASEDFA